MFKRKTTSSAWTVIITTIVSFVLLFVIVGLLLALAGAKCRRERPAGIGRDRRAMRGPSIPCMPGTVCSVPPERWASEKGSALKTAVRHRRFRGRALRGRE